MPTPTLKFMDGSGYDNAGNGFRADGSPYKALPNLQAYNQTSTQPQINDQDPITRFNLQIFNLLSRAQQSGVNNAPLYQQAGNLQNTQIEQSMAPASELGIEGLRPVDALNARQNAGELYNPEIRSLNDRIKLNQESVDKFEKALKTAKDYGEEYAKSLKPDEATIQAVKQQMAAGFVPSASVIEKLGKYITPDDWNALSEAKDKSSQTTENINGIAYRVTYDDMGNVKNKVELGPSGDPDKPTDTEQKDSTKAKIIDEAKAELERQKASSVDHMANPNTYREFMTKYIQAGGNQASFKAAVSIQQYIDPINQKGDLRQAGGTTGRSVR